jgi:hypothetical protein
MSIDWKVWRRERRLLKRVDRARWRLEHAERERAWAIKSAQAAGVSLRSIAAAAGLSPTRIHQLVTATNLDALDGELGELRAAGWPAPEDPNGSDDEDLAGRDLVADRLVDEVAWLRGCAEWLHTLETSPRLPVVNLRPEADRPTIFNLVVNLERVRRVVERIAYDIDELARSRRVDDLEAARVATDARAERRRRLAEPDLDLRSFLDRPGVPSSSTLQMERAWEKWQEERRQRGETDQTAWDIPNPFRPR